MQVNAKGVPQFQEDLIILLNEGNIPETIVSKILKPLEELAKDINTGSTTFPFFADKVCNLLIDYYNGNINSNLKVYS